MPKKLERIGTKLTRMKIARNATDRCEKCRLFSGLDFFPSGSLLSVEI